MNNNNMTKKVDVLQHIQASIDILNDLKYKNKETLETWRYLKLARSAIAENINHDARGK